MSPLIELQSLSFGVSRIGGSQEAVLADINLSINSGEAIACLGKNGSGKTTLLKLMAGLLEPTAGKILFRGSQAINDADLPGSRIAWISSGVDKYFIGATVQEDVEFGLLQMRLSASASEVSRKVNQVLEQYKLEDFRHFQPLALDASAKRRLAFASAIITEPDLLLIDELFSGLNEAESTFFRRKIKELTSAGCAVVRVTQQIPEIMDYQRAIVLSGKAIVADGKPTDIFCDPERIAEWGLNIPVALTVSSELCREGLLRQPFLVVDELVQAIGGRCASAPVNTGAHESANLPPRLLIKPGTAVLLTGRSQTALAKAAENLKDMASFDGLGGAQKKPIIAFLPRNPEELFIESTVWKEVAFGLNMAGGAEARVVEALRLCGLEPDRYSWRDPRKLSLGEQRRVTMAAVLALSPEGICLEDPLRGLDAEGWESLGEILEMLKTRGTALLLVSADVDQIWKYCDSVYLLESGSGQLLGPVSCDPDHIMALLAGSESGVACYLPEELRLWRYLRQIGIVGDDAGDSNDNDWSSYGHFMQMMMDALKDFLGNEQKKKNVGNAGNVGNVGNTGNASDVPSDCGEAGIES